VDGESSDGIVRLPVFGVSWWSSRVSRATCSFASTLRGCRLVLVVRFSRGVVNY
jgi:hypothetical protein